MPLQATSGAASYDAFGGGVPAVPTYIEDVFSTYLYAGNDSTQDLTNGIDMSGKGGLSILKIRNYTGESFQWFDTVRGANKMLQSAGTQAQSTVTNYLNSFNSNGITVGSNANVSGYNYASWTFRKQPKFFDIVTWTGDGTGARTITHNLGSVAGCIINKPTSATGDWFVYHRGNPSPAQDYLLRLNTTLAAASGNAWNNYAPTSTDFQVSSARNVDGVTYVACLFAHDAGGFGLTGTDNVISCGSYTGNGSATGPVITLGYEPQWLMIKNTSGNSNWSIFDNMRGFSVTSDKWLQANTSGAEADITPPWASPSATGFYITDSNGQVNNSGNTYIYIAIRRGPMKVPTSGTSVFSPIVSSASAGTPITTGFPVDVQFPIYLDTSFTIPNVVDRLRSASSTTTPSGLFLDTSITNAEASGTVTRNWGNTGFDFPNYYVGARTLFLNFRRATGYFDEVCYDSNGVAGTQIPHNLGVKPQLMIVKCRNNAVRWVVYAEPLGATQYLVLNLDFPASTNIDPWNNTEPTASVFTVEDGTQSNAGYGYTYVAYLFATCAGVSKVGSYTGTGTTKQVDCGFTGGARFVLIKRTDSTGDWYVWDSARGIVSGNDPYLRLNSTAAEVTTTDYIDTYSAGFEISSTAPSAINASGGTFIFLAIA